MSVTLRGKAKELDASHTIVYRAVNGKPFVSEKLIEES